MQFLCRVHIFIMEQSTLQKHFPPSIGIRMLTTCTLSCKPGRFTIASACNVNIKWPSLQNQALKKTITIFQYKLMHADS
jgi:hypothetical protein